MLATATPRGPRANNKSRGSSRGVSRAKELRNGQTRSSAITSVRGSNTQTGSRARSNTSQQRNQSWRTPAPDQAQLKSAIFDHAGNKTPRPAQGSWRDAASADNALYKAKMNDLYQALKENRERERRKAIQDGFLADPDKPTSLANAITPVGTCQDMCPEFERVERIVQLMVDANEKMPSFANGDIKVPCEDLMVKRFRRSAAGYDEQLPSDIRPPAVLQKSLDHLINDIVGGPETLASTHKFVWDRTRGIRNDFSIQQVSKVEDLRTAISCFERIARFHILSLHQLSRTNSDNGEFDHFQEREQLNNTLLSLMYYYDDSRRKMTSPNEAEFRAYCIIFEIQDQRPDIEDRAQNWPATILKDPRVKNALKLYAAAGNTSDDQGPLRPRTPFTTAQANSGSFFDLVNSNAISYTMACVAEIYFNHVRSRTLEAIWKAYRGKRPGGAVVEDWILSDVTQTLGFDDENQTYDFCQDHGFEFLEREDGEQYLNLAAVVGGSLMDSNPRRKQVYSKSLVEHKRFSRSLPAVINGLNVSEAQSQGHVDPENDDASEAGSEPLFLTDNMIDHVESEQVPPSQPNIQNNPFMTNEDSASAKILNSKPFSSIPTFGMPSGTSSPAPFSASRSPSPLPNAAQSSQAANPFAPKSVPKFNFFPNTEQPSISGPPPSNLTSPNSSSPNNLLSKPTTGTEASKPQIIEPVRDHNQSGSQSVFDQFPLQPQQPLPAPLLTQTDSSETTPNPFFSTKPSFLAPPPSNLSTIAKPDQDYGEQAKPLFDASKASFPSSGAQSFFQVQNEPQKSTNQTSHQHGSDSTAISPKTNPVTDISGSLKVPASQPNPNPSLEFLSSPAPSSGLFSANASLKATAPNPDPRAISSQPPTDFSYLHNSSQSRSVAPSNAQAFEGAQARETSSNLNPLMQEPNSTQRTFDTGLGSTTKSSGISNARPAAIQKVAHALVFGHGGLLQQYVEITIKPVIQRTIRQLEDERSWRKAASYRGLLLMNKYGKRWKKVAWQIGLARRGKQRRHNLAQSTQRISLSVEQSPRKDDHGILSSMLHSKSKQGIFEAVEMGQAPTNIAKKRQSLPNDLNREMTGALTPNIGKRKREENEEQASDRTQSRRSNHKRSSTVDEPVMSAPPHRLARRRQVPLPNFNHSSISSDSLLGRTISMQARTLAPNVRSDATHTDYFRLKALGINPDTPIVPQTRKKASTQTRDNLRNTDDSQASKSKAAAETVSVNGAATRITPKSPKRKLDDPDEEFFASIKKVRDTLADSTSWFQNERHSLERSQTSQTVPQFGNSPPSPRETPAERRLREIRERGYTPSRSEIRLRAMGDKAYLPEGFWDGEGMGRSLYGSDDGTSSRKEKEAESEDEFVVDTDDEVRPAMGFAALNKQHLGNGVVNGQRPVSPDSPIQQHPPQQSGTSIEDAIEL